MKKENSKLDAALADIALRKAVREEMDEVEESPWFRWVVVFLWLSFAGILGLCWWTLGSALVHVLYTQLA